MISSLPPPVHDLLANRVDSFEKLDLVVALAEAPRSMMTLDELAARFAHSREEVRQLANQLRGDSLVEIHNGVEVCLLPPTSNDQAAIRQLVELYRADPFTVVKAMGEISLGRIRTLASRAFSKKP